MNPVSSTLWSQTVLGATTKRFRCDSSAQMLKIYFLFAVGFWNFFLFCFLFDLISYLKMFIRAHAILYVCIFIYIGAVRQTEPFCVPIRLICIEKPYGFLFNPALEKHQTVNICIKRILTIILYYILLLFIPRWMVESWFFFYKILNIFHLIKYL